MDPKYSQMITELEMSMNRYEDELNQLILEEMIKEDYVKFHKIGNDYIFEDSIGIKYPANAEIQSTADLYFETLNRSDIEIIL